MTAAWESPSSLLVPFLEAALVLALSVLPGWVFTRGLRRDPLARLLAAIVVSYTLLYLLEFGSYIVSGPGRLPLGIALVLAAAALARIVVRTRGGHDDERFDWRAALGWFGLVSWLLGLQGLIAVYGASTWFGDWYEHYERTILFVDQLPPTTRFLKDLWTLPARGPVFNAAAAVFLASFQKTFWTYQIVATVLNSFLVVPLALLVRDVARIEARKALCLGAVLLAVAPFAVTQETYAWTKFFTTGLYLAGVYFYLRAQASSERGMLVWSAVAFGLGVLAHYMVIPMAAPFALHALYRAARRRLPASALLLPAAVGVLLLAPWFVYAVSVFGIGGTVTAHTTFKNSEEFLSPDEMTISSRAEAVLGNIVATLVPSGLRHGLPDLGWSPTAYEWGFAVEEPATPESALARSREVWLADLVDNCDSLVGDLGLAGLAALVYVAWGRIRRRPGGVRGASPEPDSLGSGVGLGPLFWLVSAGVVLVVFSWAARIYCPNGLMHTGLQAYVLLVAVFLVAKLRRAPAHVVRTLAALFVLESALAVGALLALESRSLPISVSAAGTKVFARTDANPNYVKNYSYKVESGAVYLADRLGDLRWPFALLATSVAAAVLAAGLTRSAARARVLTKP